MEENNSKRGQLKTIVLLLIGFIIGFATHAFTVSKEAVMPDVENNTKEEMMDAKLPINEDLGISKDISAEKSKGDEQVPADKEVNTPFNATPNNSSNSGYSFSVTDQSAGGVVYISQLVFAEESWIAVREDNNGKLGNILGAHRYSAGEHTGVVELLRNTEPGQTYYAVVYVDDGDKKFDHEKDLLLADSSGDVTAAIFRTY